ncbi:MAG: aminomethyl-transferring glycine dehydrogenase subunit GcvPB [Candidatus Tectomicrobia bacterium]|uniref:Probable glycine dehydrogenase (decarboxylating) subunit 2 n=1 Tax=Tectimicrobiota bacterium TaxID=2528274 RepID=A0A932CMV1_UNCTE|nr:aminomethyl-transferring glycine dehydrogenase subunit GcvPB [Candidatus Tectomicrobia bacterium]
MLEEPLIFERSVPGRKGYSLPACDVPPEDLEGLLPARLQREEIPDFPEVSEVEVVRHYTRLSQKNYGIDLGFFPLGSCTMKYNPKIHEDIAQLPGFLLAHPYQPEELSQGLLRLIFELEGFLAEICGMDRFTLQPAAGAQGELTGLMMVRAYLESLGESRKKILLPDSAHGTNPASSTLCGYEVVEVRSNEQGNIDPASLAQAMDDQVAALMLTNPNTLGLFERHVLELTEIVHSRGGFVYYDGANLNALLGIARPGDMGADVIQVNLHKTFSTPHGGGGPGAGPVGIKKKLEPFLPVPTVEREGAIYFLDYNRPQSIGKMRAFYGNFGILVRAYAYIRSMGPEQLRKVSETAIINANYLMAKLKQFFHLAYDRPCMHEVVLSDKHQVPKGVHTLDIAKRLMDYGFHPPTIYFPLIVKGAMMIEPTETESRESLDGFVAAMEEIAREAERDPDLLRDAPKITRLVRLDEVRANREPRLIWRKENAMG